MTSPQSLELIRSIAIDLKAVRGTFVRAKEVEEDEEIAGAIEEAIGHLEEAMEGLDEAAEHMEDVIREERFL